MKRFSHVKPLLLLVLLLTCRATGLFAQLAVFNPTSPALSNYGPSPWSPTTPPPTGISVTGWTRAAGVGTSGTAAGSAWGGNDWQQTNNPSDALASNKYVYFSIQATAGYTMSLTTWNECYRRSGTGPANGLLQYSVNAGPYTDITTFAFTNTTSGGACLTPVDLSTISALQNVAAGVTVTFRILLYGATGSTGTWYIYQASGMSLSGTVTAVPSCTTPASLAAAGITTTTANLSWGAVAGALDYEYIVDQSPSTPATSGTSTTNTFYNATGLTPATTYYLHVRTHCVSGYSAWATAFSFTTLAPCSNPTGLAAGSITTTTANLSWNSVATALNYEYIVDQSPSTPAVAGTVTTNLFYNATGLTPATTYYLHVRANCGNPNYSAWVTISFITLTPCSSPTGLASNNITTTSADLSWNTVATALNYEYIVDQSPATPATSGTVTTNLFYNATGLTPSTTYYLHVRANCGTPNYSAWVTIPFTTLTP
ncbi:MAG: fibronectin type III domain-containing protein, partial [Bacteroidetes bacterium]|nr:fibronectin type III domain-containing protein [Bacteroidota bacterium]